MTSHKRPGGLTALAVVNFVFGGLSILGALGSAILIPFLGMAQENADMADVPPEQAAQVEALMEMGGGLFVVLALISAVTAVLLIASGVGYLKLKKFLGRTLGNSYAIISIIYGIGAGMLMPVELGGGFNIMAILGLIYPVITLILLNTTFKEDFVN